MLKTVKPASSKTRLCERLWARAGRFAALLAVTALAIVLAACGDDRASDEPDTPTVQPEPEPTIEGSLYRFPGRGYEAMIPEGWEADPNTVTATPLKLDTFFAPDEVDGVQTNITVACELLPGSTTADEYLEAHLNTVRALGAEDVAEVGSLSVSGRDGEMVTYTLKREEIILKKTEVVLADERCGWIIGLTAAPSTEEAGRQTLGLFLDAFRFIAVVR